MLVECPVLNGEVMIRTYDNEGVFYKKGWTTLLTLWDRGYIIPLLELQEEGRSTMVGEGIVELILVG
jgi:hypothetical protein